MKLLNRLLRKPDVLAARGKKHSRHYQDIVEGLFTKPVQIAPRAVAWPESEVAAINAAQIAGKTDDEIRILVKQLEAQRRAA